mmetsp:Transcript_30866/g.34543  ORF Transcript_30866/g.34543 Transcript_30866/m.34543 type:complete len:82 (+) Transcript_30866:353-598(+)
MWDCMEVDERNKSTDIGRRVTMMRWEEIPKRRMPTIINILFNNSNIINIECTKNSTIDDTVATAAQTQNNVDDNDCDDDVE